MTARPPQSAPAETAARARARRSGVVGLLGAVVVVVLHAGVQALLVLPDPTPEATPGFLALAAASAVAVVLALWLLVAAVGGRRPSPALILRCVLLLVVAAALSLLSPWLVPLTLVVGAPFLLAGRGALAALRRSPGRSLGVLVGSLVLALVLWAAAVASGLFLGPRWGAPATWLGLGLAAAVVLRLWAGVVRASGSVPVRGDG